MDVYYHYTILRLRVGLLGIEPRPHAPKASILPLYDSPLENNSVMPRVGVPRIALGSHAPEACILLLYYTPTMSATMCG